MRIRHLRLRVDTDHGLHGVDIPFADGLVVLWADNSMGKSTCLRAILVALGMEAMLSTRKLDIPLPQVMKTELESANGIARVTESNIYLELENKSRKRIVAHRTIVGARNSDLITVSHGPALTEPEGSYPLQDFFVSRSGAATRETGFHYFLADFLGWNVPSVRTFENKEYPLYLQCIFPYLMVEQKRGWANLDPPLPSQFRIREAHKRSLEFLLDLDASKISRKRMKLLEEQRDLKFQWAALVSEIKSFVQAGGGLAAGLPESPITKWPPEIYPYVQIAYEKGWMPGGDLMYRFS